MIAKGRYDVWEEMNGRGMGNEREGEDEGKCQKRGENESGTGSDEEGREKREEEK